MATLKISDLSVGDRVKYKGKECTIASIYGDYPHEVALTCQGICYGCAYIDHLEPIPITAEVLEKNGFVKGDDFLHKIDLPDNILLGVRRQTDGYIFELKREKRRIGELLVIIRGIRYIHQLQHALRLAGVDKEVNL